MTFNQLVYFCMLAENSNISHTADKLWISQPALSKAIRSLELEIGVDLFSRVGRNIVLNKSGSFYYKKVKNLLIEFESVRKELLENIGLSASLNVLFSAGNFISSWIANRYLEFFPNNRINIKSCYIPTFNELLDCDFYIFATPETNSDDMECINLIEEKLMLAMGQDHPLAEKENISLSDTINYEYQSLPNGENLCKNLFKFCNQAGFEPKITLCTEDSFSFFESMGSNGLLAFIPEITAFSAIKKGVVVKSIKKPYCSRVVQLGWFKKRYLSNADKAFVEFCKNILKNNALVGCFLNRSGEIFF